MEVVMLMLLSEVKTAVDESEVWTEVGMQQWAARAAWEEAVRLLEQKEPIGRLHRTSYVELARLSSVPFEEDAGVLLAEALTRFVAEEV